ncbi:MAG TPA: FKBP-type peptidyl-prolyl cis-trans isomerase [Bacteroidales bacterium]|nr:FKBP-type peptidyl-prolyl cis-trans isomerase [Bacteroidales bacterium]
MKINKNTVVSLTYQLRLDNAQGEIVETVTSENPFTMLFGSGNLLEAFENNLHGKDAGDHFEFSLSCNEAYGETLEEAITDLPIEIFMIDGKIDDQMLTVGNFIPMQDQTGNTLHGRVVKRGLDKVTMDFNHPMAGKNLHFEGDILSVREGTAEELTHGHVHGEGGHHHE